jgi:hypothetical protein
MAELAALTESEVTDFVRSWYLDLLDVHAPVEDLLSYLDGDAVEMRLPEVTLHGEDAFRDWYDRIVTTFFDEVHDIRTLEVTCRGDQADVKLLVNWQAHVWVAPSPKSQWIGFNAGQTWLVRRSPATGKPVIVVYGVDTFIPMEGSSNLPVLPREVVGQYYSALEAGDTEAVAALAASGVTVDDAPAGLERILTQGTRAVALVKGGATYFEVGDGHITSLRRFRDAG